MPPDDIDDLFRSHLAGHETPPGDALWARLNAATAPPDAAAATERLDKLFQKGLSAHVTSPGREMWERLEDEHLRPRKRRVAARWRLAMAAALAILLVAGGTGLWLGFPWNNTQNSTIASQTKRARQSSVGTQLPQTTTTGIPEERNPAKNKTTVAANAPSETPQTVTTGVIRKNITVQATRPANLASTASKASMAASGPSLRHPLGTIRQPDAAADHRPLVARTTLRATHRPAQIRLTAADEQQLTTLTAPTVAVAPKLAPTAEIIPTATIQTTSLTSTDQLIIVDVRNGNNANSRPTKITSTALATVEVLQERRGLGGRLLHQASNLVRGERISLAEVTGLPENVTFRATIAGRSLTKSFKL